NSEVFVEIISCGEQFFEVWLLLCAIRHCGCKAFFNDHINQLISSLLPNHLSKPHIILITHYHSSQILLQISKKPLQPGIYRPDQVSPSPIDKSVRIRYSLLPTTAPTHSPSENTSFGVFDCIINEHISRSIHVLNFASSPSNIPSICIADKLVQKT
uniref:Ovule protein n=1 Tax=Ascaris lumbricoides TaxID=6252 RepID=A0A0M3HGQ6_ASCLU